MPRTDYKLNKVPDGNISLDSPLASYWRSWFEDLYRIIGSENNYASDQWAPTITGLTGTASITNAKYFKFRKMLQISLVIDPAGSTDSVLGTTYISALPLNTIAAGSCPVFNMATRDLVGNAYIEPNSNKIYLPNWSSITDNLSVSGILYVNG